MASFRYSAIAANGAIIKGVLEAPSEQAVIQHLRKEGHFPIAAKPDRDASLTGLLRSALRFKSGLPLRKLSLATQELSVLMMAGLELDRALSILASMQDIGPLSKSFLSVRNKVRDGSSFADALAGEGRFPRFYVGMVR